MSVYIYSGNSDISNSEMSQLKEVIKTVILITMTFSREKLIILAFF